jgi:hypothetical protein
MQVAKYSISHNTLTMLMAQHKVPNIWSQWRKQKDLRSRNTIQITGFIATDDFKVHCTGQQQKNLFSGVGAKHRN